MSTLVDSEPWAPLIGRLFIAFGPIEKATHECIRQWAGDIFYSGVKKKSFGRRLELTIQLVTSQPFTENNKSDFIENLKIVKKLAEYRNLIAHSPLSLILFRDEPTIPFIEAISDNTEQRHIELAELKGIVEDAETCAQKVHQHLAAFRGEQVRHRYGNFDGTCDA